MRWNSVELEKRKCLNWTRERNLSWPFKPEDVGMLQAGTARFCLNSSSKLTFHKTALLNEAILHSSLEPAAWHNRQKSCHETKCSNVLLSGTLLALWKSILSCPVKSTPTAGGDGCNLGTKQCFPEPEEIDCWVSRNVTPPTGNFQPFPSSFLPLNIYSKCTKLSTGGGGTPKGRSWSRGWVAPVQSSWQYPDQSSEHPSHTTRAGSRGDVSDSYAGIEWEEGSWNNHQWVLFPECVNTELLFYSLNRKN